MFRLFDRQQMAGEVNLTWSSNGKFPDLAPFGDSHLMLIAVPSRDKGLHEALLI